MSLFIRIILVLSLASCAKVKSIGTKTHQFNANPKRIIWLQIAGLNEEHLALIRYNKSSSLERTSFENSLCVGKAWSYNLYELRPSANSSFNSQILGSKNIKNNCSDYEQKPFWNYIENLRYETAIFESGKSLNNSLLKSLSCKGQEDFLGGVYFFKMSAPFEGMSENFYKLADDGSINNQGIYFDLSCKSNKCFSSMEDSVRKIYTRFAGNKAKTLFVLRDFSYLNALKLKNIAKANEILFSIDRLYEYFQTIADKKGSTLVLLTSGESYNLELPRKGREWEQYINKGRGVTFKKSSLISPIFSYGAAAENFCGIFEESEIMKRILWSPGHAQVVEDVRNLFK